MSGKVSQSSHEDKNTTDTNGFGANRSGPLTESNRSTPDENGPSGPLLGTDNLGSEAESVHPMTAPPVENTEKNEAVRPDGSLGSLISGRETPNESIDDAFAIPDHLNRTGDRSESPSNGDAVEREAVGSSHEQLKF